MQKDGSQKKVDDLKVGYCIKIIREPTIVIKLNVKKARHNVPFDLWFRYIVKTRGRVFSKKVRMMRLR